MLADIECRAAGYGFDLADPTQRDAFSTAISGRDSLCDPGAVGRNCDRPGSSRPLQPGGHCHL
jgi:hypothetical protein